MKIYQHNNRTKLFNFVHAREEKKKSVLKSTKLAQTTKFLENMQVIVRSQNVK